MAETKRFPLDEVLSISTGRLVAARHIDAIYEILNWMTGDSLFTHQLGRACQECRPWLLRWFPELEKATGALALLDADVELEGPTKGCALWVGKLALMGLPQHYDLPRIPADDHERKDAIQEAVELFGEDRVIVVQPGDGRGGEG